MCDVTCKAQNLTPEAERVSFDVRARLHMRTARQAADCVCEMELQRPLSGAAQNSQQHRPVCWAVMVTVTDCHAHSNITTPIKLDMPIATLQHPYNLICPQQHYNTHTT